LKPLVIHTAAARDVFVGFIGLWVATELISQIPTRRQRVSRTFDPTRLFVSISLVGGFVLAVRAAERRLWTFGGGWPSIAVGLGIAASGVVLRQARLLALAHERENGSGESYPEHPRFDRGDVGILEVSKCLSGKTTVTDRAVLCRGRGGSLAFRKADPTTRHLRYGRVLGLLDAGSTLGLVVACRKLHGSRTASTAARARGRYEGCSGVCGE
jgi:hypothetical protein